MSLLPTGKFRHACRTRDAFIKDTWSEQAQASEDLQKDGIRGRGLMSNDRISLAHSAREAIRGKESGLGAYVVYLPVLAFLVMMLLGPSPLATNTPAFPLTASWISATF